MVSLSGSVLGVSPTMSGPIPPATGVCFDAGSRRLTSGRTLSHWLGTQGTAIPPPLVSVGVTISSSSLSSQSLSESAAMADSSPSPRNTHHRGGGSFWAEHATITRVPRRGGPPAGCLRRAHRPTCSGAIESSSHPPSSRVQRLLRDDRVTRKRIHEYRHDHASHGTC